MEEKKSEQNYVGSRELPKDYIGRYNNFCNGDGKGLMQDDGRFMAYDKCRDAFKRYCKDEFDDEIMALHLYAFLSSWGMTTYNQYLMKKNYTCLKGVARVLREKQDEWSKFSRDFCPDKNKAGEREKYIKTVLDMKTEIVKALNKDDEAKLPEGASNVLINKIIMVTYGCIPAFDSRIRAEWKKLGYDDFKRADKDWLTDEFLGKVYDYADHNRQKLLALPSKNGYSVFKKIDMILWEKETTAEEQEEEAQGK